MSINNIWFPDQIEPVLTDSPSEREAYLVYWKQEKSRCIDGFYLADDQVFISGRLYFHTVYWKIAMYIKVKGKKVRRILTPLLRDIDWDIFNDLERCDEEGKFYALVGSRDFGKSIIAGSCVGHQYTFYPNSECVVSGGAATFIKLATNKVEDGLLNMHPAFKKQRLISDWKKEVRAGWKDKSTGQPNPKSSNSVIYVRNYQEGTDTMAANGTRPSFHLIDEIGTIPNLIGCIKDGDGCWWSGSDEETDTDSVDKEDGIDNEGGEIRDSSEKPSCLVFLAGTGGDMNKGKEAPEVFFKPEAYNILEFDNPEDTGPRKMGRFISSLRAKMNFKEKTSLSKYLGISHPELDRITILVSNEERADKEWWIPAYEKALKSGNSKTILKFKAYWPKVPSDSFIVLTHNNFNVEAARAQQARLKSLDIAPHCIEVYNDGEKLTHRTVNKFPITEFPLKTQDPDAPIQMWEAPIENSPFGLYTAGVDPYRQGQAEFSDSLGAVYIFKRMNTITGEGYQNMFVAAYVARPESKEKWNETARNLIKYYNARTLCENDEYSFIDFMISKGDGHYLEDQPKWLQEYVPNTTVKRGKGIHRSSLTIRNFLDGTFKSYLDEIIDIQKDDNGSIIKETTGVSRIPDIMLLEEVCKFSTDTKNKVNTDRVVAAELAVALAFKLNPIIGAVGITDKRLEAIYANKKKTQMFSTKKSLFKRHKKLF